MDDLAVMSLSRLLGTDGAEILHFILNLRKVLGFNFFLQEFVEEAEFHLVQKGRKSLLSQLSLLILDSAESLSEDSGLPGSLLTKSYLKSASASVQSLLSPQSTELSQSESPSSVGLEIVLYQREKKRAKAFRITETSFVTSIVARVPSLIEWDRPCYGYMLTSDCLLVGKM